MRSQKEEKIMLRCESCGWIGEESELVEYETTYEAYYDAPVRGYHPLKIHCCPECGDDENFTDFSPELEEEFFAEELREIREEDHPVHEFRELSEILFGKAEKEYGLSRERIMELSKTI